MSASLLRDGREEKVTGQRVRPSKAKRSKTA